MRYDEHAIQAMTEEYENTILNSLRTEYTFRVEAGHTTKSFEDYFGEEPFEVAQILRANGVHIFAALFADGILDHTFGDGFSEEVLDYAMM